MEITHIKLKKHFENLINNPIKSGNPIRDELIKSDALKNLNELKSKRPDLFKETKSKKSD